MPQDVQSLQQLLDHIAGLPAEDGRVSVETVVESIGNRSFGPMLLVIGLALFSPLSGIPGMATTSAICVMLIALQMLIGRKHFWLPRWLLRRSVSKGRLDKTLGWMRKPAGFIDHLLRPRLAFFVHRPMTWFISILCVFIALGLPFMELIPFTSTLVGMALSLLGMSLVARDGLLVLIAFVSVSATFSLVAVNIL